MSIVLDCTESPSVDAIRGAGAVAVSRYLSWLYRWGGQTHGYVNPKVIQKSEFDRLTQAGIGVILNWEFDARDWLGGASAGHEHATEAVRQAKLIGLPDGTAAAIPGSCDFDMTYAQWKDSGRAYATEYCKVVEGSGYLPGPYGPWDVIEWCAQEQLGKVFWQAGMSWAWSGGRNKNVHPAAHLFQQRHMNVGGIDCDVNVILKTPFGAYPASGVVVPTKESPLLEDGILGRNTIARAQNILGTPVDGVITQPPGKSSLVQAIQHRLNVTISARLAEDGQGINQDGHSVFNTTRALQRYLGTAQDGVLSLPTSECVKALQRRLNTGKF